MTALDETRKHVGELQRRWGTTRHRAFIRQGDGREIPIDELVIPDLDRLATIATRLLDFADAIDDAATDADGDAVGCSWIARTHRELVDDLAKVRQ